MGKKTNSTDIILKAAIEVFAEVGYSGARVDEIAKRAGVNKATIYYNIGNKQKLYAMALESIFQKALSVAVEEIHATNDPKEKLSIYIRNVAATIENNPGFPNILLWEHASGGRHFPPEIITMISRMLGTLIDILNEGHNNGIFKRPNPLLIQFMIMATMVFFKTSIPIRKKFTGLPKQTFNLPETLSGNIVAELEELIINAVRLT